jgi:predicted secreted Zn-dependent protease
MKNYMDESIKKSIKKIEDDSKTNKIRKILQKELNIIDNTSEKKGENILYLVFATGILFFYYKLANISL